MLRKVLLMAGAGIIFGSVSGCMTIGLWSAGKQEEQFERIIFAYRTPENLYLEYSARTIESGLAEMCRKDISRVPPTFFVWRRYRFAPEPGLVRRWVKLNLEAVTPGYEYYDGAIPADIYGHATLVLLTDSADDSVDISSLKFPMLAVREKYVLKERAKSGVAVDRELPSLPFLYVKESPWHYARYVLLPLTVALDTALVIPELVLWRSWLCVTAGLGVID